MKKAQIIDLVREGSIYRGLIQCEGLNQTSKAVLRLRNNETKDKIEISCSLGAEGYSFEFNCLKMRLKKGTYDICIYDKQNGGRLYDLSAEEAGDKILKGKYDLDLMFIEKTARVYFPACDGKKRLQFHFCSMNNEEYFDIKHMPCEKYVITEDAITFHNLEWEKIHCKELRAYFMDNGGENYFETSVTYGEDLSYSLAMIKDLVNANEKSKRFRMIVLMNDGNFLKKYWIQLTEKTTMPLVNPVIDEWDDFISEEAREEQRKLMLFYTPEYYAEFAFEDEDSFYGKYAEVNTIKFDMKNQDITIDASYIDFTAVPKRIRLAQRFEDSYKDYPIEKIYVKKGMTRLKATIDLAAMQMIPFYLDFHVVFEYQGREILARVGCKDVRDSRINKRLIRFTYRTPDGYVAYPYSTMYNKLSLVYREITKYDADIYKVKEMIAAWTFKFARHYLNRKDIWLMCEKNCEMAQDNGFYFFKYCMDNKVKHKVYYIIDKDSPDYKRLLPYKKNVIPFMSIRHMLLIQGPVVLVSSEAKSNYFARKYVRGRIIRRISNKRYVFLQHGVIALKKIDSTFSRTALKAKLFVTSSQFEKSIITENFGYPDEEVIVTGLTRWDVLEDKSKEQPKREIVLMPTWRTWLEKMTEEEFLESDYYHMYSTLLQRKDLISYLEENDIIINFVIHPMLKKYVSKFVSNCSNVKIYQFGEAPINQLIMKASLLITDYSSVSWDICYMNKPVIYFRFDIERYEEEQGAYIDLRENIIGNVCYEVDELIDLLKESANANFIVDKQFIEKRKQYFAYEDKHNSERVLEEISKCFY